MTDPIVLLSVIGGVMTVVNQTLIRRKHWLGWLFGIPNILLSSYINWQTGAYGYIGRDVFWLYNAIRGIAEWRHPQPILDVQALWAGTVSGPVSEQYT